MRIIAAELRSIRETMDQVEATLASEAYFAEGGKK